VFFVLKKINKLIKIKVIKKIKDNIFQFKESLKISFEDREVIYINKINIPPIKIKNKEYENQKFIFIEPEKSVIHKVCVINIKPIDKG
jgi:hypothetical protein